MKKHVLAFAVAGALAAPAFAQNVTISGAMDVSVANVEFEGTTYTSQGNADYFASSNLTISGTEDLGGGMKAGFVLAGDLNTNNGNGDGTGGGLRFDRAANVFISSPELGTISFGNSADVVTSANGLAQAGMNLFDFKEADTTYTAVTNNTRYASPAIAGWTVEASYSNSTANTEAGGDVSDGYTQADSFMAVGVSGTVSGLNVKLATARKSTGAAHERYNVLSVNRNLGFADVTVVFNGKKIVDGASSNDVQVGVVAPIGKNLNLRASVARHNHDTSTSERKAWGAAVEQVLSKRTSIYAGYAIEDVNNGLSGDYTTAVAGIVHKF